MNLGKKRHAWRAFFVCLLLPLVSAVVPAPQGEARALAVATRVAVAAATILVAEAALLAAWLTLPVALPAKSLTAACYRRTTVSAVAPCLAVAFLAPGMGLVAVLRAVINAATVAVVASKTSSTAAAVSAAPRAVVSARTIR